MSLADMQELFAKIEPPKHVKDCQRIGGGPRCRIHRTPLRKGALLWECTKCRRDECRRDYVATLSAVMDMVDSCLYYEPTMVKARELLKELEDGLSEEERRLVSVLLQPIHSIRFSSRAISTLDCIFDRNRDCLYSLVTVTPEYLLRHRNLGKITLEGIKQKLAHYGLQLGMPISTRVQLAVLARMRELGV